MKKENNKPRSMIKSAGKKSQKDESRNPLEKMSKIDPDVIAKGAAGVAVAAGVVATGMALSKKENRRKVGHAAEKGIDTIQTVARDLKDRVEEIYPQVQHEIAKLSKEQKSLRGRKSSRKHGV